MGVLAEKVPDYTLMPKEVGVGLLVCTTAFISEAAGAVISTVNSRLQEVSSHIPGAVGCAEAAAGLGVVGIALGVHGLRRFIKRCRAESPDGNNIAKVIPIRAE